MTKRGHQCHERNNACPPQATGDTLAADERLATKEGRSQFWRATFSCWLGTAMEYVDFALYGLAAGMVFGDVFFPEATPMVALLASFATYSVGFIARPIGALVFGWIGDRKGRRVVLITTVALMGVSTTLIGLILLRANRHLGANLPGDPAFCPRVRRRGGAFRRSGDAGGIRAGQTARAGRLDHRYRLQQRYLTGLAGLVAGVAVG